jgi:hypothetical protein
MAVLRDSSNVALTILATPANSAAVTNYDTQGRDVSTQSKATYSVTNTFAPVAAATDVVLITGSNTKTIRVVSIYFATSNTLGGVSAAVFVVKRGQLNQGGTFVPGTAVPHDSLDAAAVATVGHYTANPTLGIAWGTINSVRVGLPPVTPTSFAGHAEDAGIELLPWIPWSFLDKLLTLRSSTESIVVNLNGATVFSGQVHAYRIVWTEE